VVLLTVPFWVPLTTSMPFWRIMSPGMQFFPWGQRLSSWARTAVAASATKPSPRRTPRQSRPTATCAGKPAATPRARRLQRQLPAQSIRSTHRTVQRGLQALTSSSMTSKASALSSPPRWISSHGQYCG
jgi:hypothetical protein